MNERRFTDVELEAGLREVGGRLAYPATVDLAPAVRARIASGRVGGFWAELLSGRLGVAPALATLALLVAATLAFQPVAASAAEALGIRGLPIFRAPAVPTPTATPAGATFLPIPGARRVPSVEAASREVGFTVLVPAELGAPDEVYVAGDGVRTQAFLVYRPRPGLPASPETGVGALLTELRGSLEPAILGKVVGPATKVEQLTIDGRPAVWITGAPHEFFYRTPSGDFAPATLRLAGNVLAWERGDLLVRLEAGVTKDVAVRVASSAR